MPLKVGITGAIGSGKTTVCKIFESLHIPVYYADVEAKKLYNLISVKEQVVHLLGEHVLNEHQNIDTKILAQLVFNDSRKLQLLNQIIHPLAIKNARAWHEKQDAPYTLKEAALLIESQSYKELDILIGVQSPEEMRIARVISRDHVLVNDVQKRMEQQLSEQGKLQHCHYIITNNEKQFLIPQVMKIHKLLIAIANEKHNYKTME